MDRTLPILSLTGIILLFLLHFLGENEVITGKLFIFFSAHSSHLICNYWLIFCLFLISYLLYNLIQSQSKDILSACITACPNGCLRFLGTAVVQLTLRRKWKCNWMFDTTVCSRWGGTSIFRKMHHQTLQWASAGWRCWGNHFHRVLLLEMQFWYIQEEKTAKFKAKKKLNQSGQ